MLVAGVFLGRNTEGLLLPLCACALAVLAVILLKSRLRFFACLVCSLALGTAAGCLAFHPALPAEGEYLVRGVVSDEIGSGSFGQIRVYLSDVSLDIYEGEQVTEGFKSVAYSLTFRAKDRTLEDNDVNGAMKKILNGLQSLGIELRS